MGFSAQVQQAQTGAGKGQAPAPSQSSLVQSQGIQTNWGASPRPMGKGGVQTNSATSGQPQMGAPNKYPNTVGQWDNKSQQPNFGGGGKGKGGMGPQQSNMASVDQSGMIENTYHPELANKPFNPQQGA